MKILQDEANKPGSVMFDVDGNEMVFIAIDDKDKGLNGTLGMKYFVMGDGKFTSEYISQL
jgi:hypothetical protein